MSPTANARSTPTSSATMRGLSLFERDEALRVRRPRIVGARTDQTVVRVLLEDVRGPAGDAAHREDRRVEIDRDAERVVGGCRVEVDVRIQLLLAFDERLDALRHIEPCGVAAALAQLARHLPQMRGAWVLGL